MQSRQRLPHIPLTRLTPFGERRARPEDLRARRGAGPHDRVEVRGGGLFGPEEVLAAEDERLLVRGYVRKGVEGVGLG